MRRKPLQYALIIVFSMVVAFSIGSSYAGTIPSGEEEQKAIIEEGKNMAEQEEDQFQSSLNQKLFSAIRLDHTRLVDELIARGANIHALNENGRTLLHKAALFGNINNMEWLVTTHRFDVMARDETGDTPAHVAAAVGSIEAMVWLANHGADMEATNDTGWTVRDVLRIFRSPERLEELDARLAAPQPGSTLSQNATEGIRANGQADLLATEEDNILHHPAYPEHTGPSHSF